MGMSFAYGPGDDKESIATLHRALDLGINFWDTADMYANGANEELISKVLAPNRDKVFIATKFGFRYPEGVTNPQSSVGAYIDTSPAWIRQAVDKSLQRLGVDVIDLYYAHRIDGKVPVEETVGAMAELVKAGKVRYLGLSEVSAETIRKAHAVHPIAALQSEYSLLTRDVERDILPTIRELGITLVPYSPLSRGLFTVANEGAGSLAANDFRRTLPRFSDANLESNARLVNEFAGFAKQKGITPAQLALAWVLAQGEDLIPIPGTKKRSRLEENACAVDVELTKGDLAEIASMLVRNPVAGERYSEGAMKLVNK